MINYLCFCTCLITTLTFPSPVIPSPLLHRLFFLLLSVHRHTHSSHTHPLAQHTHHPLLFAHTDRRQWQSPLPPLPLLHPTTRPSLVSTISLKELKKCASPVEQTSTCSSRTISAIPTASSWPLLPKVRPHLSSLRFHGHQTIQNTQLSLRNLLFLLFTSFAFDFFSLLTVVPWKSIILAVILLLIGIAGLTIGSLLKVGIIVSPVSSFSLLLQLTSHLLARCRTRCVLF